MSNNGSSNGHSLARERLEPIVRRMRPDLRLSVEIVRSVVHVYYNIRYIDMDRQLIGVLEDLKRKGVLCQSIFDAFSAIYEELGLSPQALGILHDLIPDHLVGPDGTIIWVAERPSPPLWRCHRVHQKPESLPDDDGDGSP